MLRAEDSRRTNDITVGYVDGELVLTEGIDRDPNLHRDGKGGTAVMAGEAAESQ